MNKGITAAMAAFVFVAGIGVGYGAKHRPAATQAMYHGKTGQEAAKALLAVALAQAGDGSWERIGVGRVYYLGGLKAEGQAIFDAVLAGKHDDGDVYRIARVYREAGEWDKARPLFERYLDANPEEAKDWAEVGAYAMLAGDRAAAERMYDNSFATEPDELWSTLSAAGAYLGVAPQQ
jgi:tetratricopeptide (TPR) repeat protein